MIQIRQLTTDDVPALLPLVAAYWAFEGLSGFDAPAVSAQLARLLGEPRLIAGTDTRKERGTSCSTRHCRMTQRR